MFPLSRIVAFLVPQFLGFLFLIFSGFPFYESIVVLTIDFVHLFDLAHSAADADATAREQLNAIADPVPSPNDSETTVVGSEPGAEGASHPAPAILGAAAVDAPAPTTQAAPAPATEDTTASEPVAVAADTAAPEPATEDAATTAPAPVEPAADAQDPAPASHPGTPPRRISRPALQSKTDD